MKGAVLFDLDGTLLDSLADLADSTNDALAQLGAAGHELSAYRRFIGNGIHALVRRALPESMRDDGTVARGVAAVRVEYGRRWNRKTRPFPGVPELLARLTEMAIPTAVLSNKPHDLTKLIVAQLLADHAFVEVIGARPEVPQKPDPSEALRIAAAIDVPPEACLLVGDSGVDMQTAVAAGMRGIGVSWGFRDEHELCANGAESIVHRPLDILAKIQ
jgi:phosphoglycolate phosphatase